MRNVKCEGESKFKWFGEEWMPFFSSIDRKRVGMMKNEWVRVRNTEQSLALVNVCALVALWESTFE